jgi:hypothetical protein
MHRILREDTRGEADGGFFGQKESSIHGGEKASCGSSAETD